MSQQLPARRIPEERVAAILARAAELDRATRESFDLDAIRAAAMEAGISRAAVDRALEEYLTDDLAEEVAVHPEPEPAPRRRRRPGRSRAWLRKVARPLAHGIIALALGVMIGAADEEVLIGLGFIGWTAFAAVQVWRRRPSGRARGFVASIALITFGAMMGFGSAGGDEDALLFAAFFGLALTGYGTLYIKLRLRGLLRRMKRVADWVTPATPAT